jgi:hypothetical protein
MAKPATRAATGKRYLSADDIDGHSDLKPWIVVSDGEGVQPFETKAEAIEAAKEQADECPNLVLGIFRLDHFVSARVMPAALFEPTPEPGN